MKDFLFMFIDFTNGFYWLLLDTQLVHAGYLCMLGLSVCDCYVDGCDQWNKT